MWFRFSRPDYFYLGRSRLVDAVDASPFNRGTSLGFGFVVLHCRWNEGRSENDGIYYPTKPHLTVVINGQKMPIATEVLSYEAIASLASKKPGVTITYWDRASDRNGSLRPGQKVLVTDGMVFDAMYTNAA
jgi:hypothetical protein